MGKLKHVAACSLLLASAACAQYLVAAAEPRYAGQEKDRSQVSIAGGTAASPPQVVAADCGPGEQLAIVRVTRNFGEGLLAWLTLGLYAPATVHYRCATQPQPGGGEINTGGDA
jgi:Bor protein